MPNVDLAEDIVNNLRLSRESFSKWEYEALLEAPGCVVTDSFDSMGNMLSLNFGETITIRIRGPETGSVWLEIEFGVSFYGEDMALLVESDDPNPQSGGAANSWSFKISSKIEGTSCQRFELLNGKHFTPKDLTVVHIKPETEGLTWYIFDVRLVRKEGEITYNMLKDVEPPVRLLSDSHFDCLDLRSVRAQANTLDGCPSPAIC
jgi:hypothetical protein